MGIYRCKCPEVCIEHKNESFEKLIEQGLICNSCRDQYYEFIKD